MAHIEKHYFVYQLFRSRPDADALIPVSRNTGKRMLDELIAAGVIPQPPRVAGREMIPESSVQKLVETIHNGGFANLRVNAKSVA